MLEIETRQIFRSNGLIDNLVFYGKKHDYPELEALAKLVTKISETVTLSACVTISKQAPQSSKSII